MDTAHAPTTQEKETEDYEFFNGFGAFACEGRLMLSQTRALDF